MDNPNFTFVIGDPAIDATGRSVTGRVFIAEESWSFEADLMRRFSPKRYQFNSVKLTIDRPFDIFEFCFFYTMVSSDRFETNTTTGLVRAASHDDLPVIKAIQETGFVVPEEGYLLSESFKDDISLMEEKLKRVREAEMMQLALSNREPDEGVTIVLDG